MKLNKSFKVETFALDNTGDYAFKTPQFAVSFWNFGCVSYLGKGNYGNIRMFGIAITLFSKVYSLEFEYVPKTTKIIKRKLRK